MNVALDPINVATLVLSAITTLWAIIVTVRGRHLLRATLKVHFGVTALDNDRPSVVRRRRKRVIVYGIVEPSRDYIIVPLAIGIENRTALPVTSLFLQLEYPADCLLDGSRVVDYGRATAMSLGEIAARGRNAQRAGTLAQVTYDVEMLRAREKLVIHELLRLPNHRIPAGVAQDVFEKRWAAIPEFITGFAVDVVVFSANSDPFATRGVVIACRADTEDSLTSMATVLFKQLWAAAQPPQGIRRLFGWLTGRVTVELAELALVPRDALDFDRKEVDASVLRHSPHAVARLDVPPSGILG